MSDIDPVFMTALQERADGDVRVEDLLDGARRSGVRHRRNRRLALSLAMAGGAAAVVLAATTLLPHPAGAPAAGASGPGSSATPAPLTVLPSRGASATTARPSGPPVATGLPPLPAGGKVGQDFQLHLDVDDPDVTIGGRGAINDYEMLRTARTRPSPLGYSGYDLIATASKAALESNAPLAGPYPGTPNVEELTLAGRPARLEYTRSWATLRWQPLPNVWLLQAANFADDQGLPHGKDAMLEIAGRVRLDRVLQCTFAFRLTWTPPGTSLTGCMIAGSGPAATTQAVLTVGIGFYVSVIDATTDTVRPNTTYAGRPVEAGPGGTGRIEIDGHQFTVDASGTALSSDARLHLLTGIVRAAPATSPLP